MRRGLAWLPLLWLLWVMGASSAAAEPLQLSAATPSYSLEGRLDHFADPTNAMTVDEVRQQAFARLPDFRSLGYGTDAHWFHVAVQPEADAPPRWILAIGAPDLEEVDVWVARADGGLQHHALGYHRPFTERPLRTRDFAVPLAASDTTDIYFRVRTNNAINVHADIWQAAAFSGEETQANFYRGLYFGILLVAVVLYAMLGARLRDATMAAYAGYLASQTLLHLGSSGYLPVLLPPDTPWFTDALPRIGWLGSAMSIVLMWDRLLQLKGPHPRIHRLYQATVWFNLALLPFALMPFLVGRWLLHVVQGANALNCLNFVIGLALLLVFWRRSRRAEFMLYFVAFVLPAFGIVINTAVNFGALQQNAFSSNFYPLAMLTHVLVMSLGLAKRLRQLQHDKMAAEQAATVTAERAEEQRRFVAMLSHEFGNPLAAIDRAAQVMQIKLPQLPPPDAQRLVQIRANAARLAGFVDNFLMTEALAHGALAASREPCNIRALLETAMQSKEEGAAHRIRLVECPTDASFPLDPTFIGVAIGNLLTNALRYTPAESVVELGAALDDQGLRVHISDHGPGLNGQELERLGTPYFRATSSLGKKGSGLGYHFARRIVEAHGGMLSARSRAGAGLEVEIRLPWQALPAGR